MTDTNPAAGGLSARMEPCADFGKHPVGGHAEAARQVCPECGGMPWSTPHGCFCAAAGELTEAERAYWQEKEAGTCENDRGGYYARGFRHGYESAARTEAADREELARVTAAVEALADQWEADDYICGEDYAREVRAALSSADVALSKGHSDTALDDLLDRERAKAWDEGVDWAWTPGHGDLRSDNPYRAAAVSPEGGGV